MKINEDGDLIDSLVNCKTSFQVASSQALHTSSTSSYHDNDSLTIWHADLEIFSCSQNFAEDPEEDVPFKEKEQDEIEILYLDQGEHSSLIFFG